MLLAFQRLTDDVEARFRPSAGARHVTPLAETAFVAEEEEGVVDGCALGGVAGEGVGVVEVLGCVEGVDVFELACVGPQREGLGGGIQVDDRAARAIADAAAGVVSPADGAIPDIGARAGRVEGPRVRVGRL